MKIKSYPGGMVAGVPAFNRVNMEYVKQSNGVTVHPKDCDCMECEAELAYERKIQNRGGCAPFPYSDPEN